MRANEAHFIPVSVSTMPVGARRGILGHTFVMEYADGHRSKGAVVKKTIAEAQALGEQVLSHKRAQLEREGYDLSEGFK